MKSGKLLYIMGNDWDWIYQRPQVLAQKLAQDYEVTVLFPRSVTQYHKKHPHEEDLSLRILWTLPFQEKNGGIGAISAVLNKHLFRDIHEFDYIYVGYPLYARYIPDTYAGKVIYDCMDNHEAIYPDQKRVERVVKRENQLIRDCDLLITTAKLLEQRINRIAGSNKAVLIRNGVQIHKIYEVKEPQIRESYKLGYIGTVSGWFDYPLLQESRRRLPNVCYHIVGPVDNAVEQQGIQYEGVVPHGELAQKVEDFDCLIMPFLVNEIVKSVDPVKLYEYIAFGKCIISVYYPEIERFEDFVYFYRTKEEYLELLADLTKAGFPPKYNAEQQKTFLEQNTWNERYQQLKQAIAGLQ